MNAGGKKIKKICRLERGFTLVELLVVIAIIGVLSSVVTANLNNSRNKAKDALIKLEVREFAKLMEMEYTDTGSYANLQSCSWTQVTSSNCDSMFGGTYVAQARNVCNKISSNANPIWGSPGYALLICNAINNSSKYSIMVSLNNGKWFCSGSNGTSENTGYWASRMDGSDIQSNSSRWPESPAGCYYNP